MFSNKKKIFVLSPMQVFPTHHFQEALVLRELVKAGYKIEVVLCRALFHDYCMAHFAFNFDERGDLEGKRKACDECQTYRKSYEGRMKWLGARFHSLNDLLSKEDILKASELASKVKVEDISDYTYKDYPIGRLASYEFILKHKIGDITQLNQDLLERYQIHLRNTFMTLFAVEKVFAANKYEAALCYNHAYSFNDIMRVCAAKHGIPTLSIHGGYNLKHTNDSLVMSWKKNFEFSRDLTNEFAATLPPLTEMRKYPLVLEHFNELLSATSFAVYSTARNKDYAKIKETLGIDSKYKKVVLLSMSSEDEYFGALFAFGTDEDIAKIHRVYVQQVEWVTKMIQYFSTRPEYKLVIRIHPREFPNKREGMLGKRVALYERLFASLPSNIYVNRPADNISLYDLLEIVDVNLVGQSSVGIECSLLGIPSLGYIKGHGLYPAGYVHEVAKDEEDLFNRLGQLLELKESRSLEYMHRAVGWLTWFYTHATLQLETSYFKDYNPGLFRSKVIRKLRRKAGKPLHSLSAYLWDSSVSKSESRVIREMLRDKIEFHQARKKLGMMSPEENKEENKKYLQKYVRDLFSLFYKLPQLEKDAELEVVPEAKDFEVVRDSAGKLLKVKVPSNYALATFLSSTIEKEI